VIDQIDDDVDDSGDVPEPDGPDWFACPILARGDMLAVIEQNAGSWMNLSHLWNIWPSERLT
jgi:hypothetical protein